MNIPVEKARILLGKSAENMSDEEIQNIMDHLCYIITRLLDNYIKEATFKNPPEFKATRK